MLLIQLTGLSGAGKSTIANMVKTRLLDEGIPTIIIDGDEYRKTICADLGFSRADRCENIRRLGKVASSYCQQGMVAIIAAINPYQEARDELASLYKAKTVFIHCPLRVLIERDTKGLYRRALLDASHPEYITNLTGVNDPYEDPSHADLILNTSLSSPEEATAFFLDFIKKHL
ncbi:adenylyl-sulfate kinase [Filimonas effusa]|uniref:Adenylyl-sulfate kinase n=1 Tax=Filimonas effusa TaxID=2508721 RepID=A0A4Q1D9B2_9BACT|nr:adenylyl-sulfate kinase [Filimonas effusa]RXK85964.1 adenylyl-sulfate kinase [Filimonas effusa]